MKVTHPRSGKSLRLPNAAFNSTFIPSAAGYYKVVIDLKEGIEIKPNDEVVKKGSTPFTLEYIAK